MSALFHHLFGTFFFALLPVSSLQTFLIPQQSSSVCSSFLPSPDHHTCSQFPHQLPNIGFSQCPYPDCLQSIILAFLCPLSFCLPCFFMVACLDFDADLFLLFWSYKLCFYLTFSASESYFWAHILPHWTPERVYIFKTIYGWVCVFWGNWKKSVQTPVNHHISPPCTFPTKHIFFPFICPFILLLVYFQF